MWLDVVSAKDLGLSSFGLFYFIFEPFCLELLFFYLKLYVLRSLTSISRGPCHLCDDFRGCFFHIFSHVFCLITCLVLFELGSQQITYFMHLTCVNGRNF